MHDVNVAQVCAWARTGLHGLAWELKLCTPPYPTAAETHRDVRKPWPTRFRHGKAYCTLACPYMLARLQTQLDVIAARRMALILKGACLYACMFSTCLQAQHDVDSEESDEGQEDAENRSRASSQAEPGYIYSSTKSQVRHTITWVGLIRGFTALERGRSSQAGPEPGFVCTSLKSQVSNKIALGGFIRSFIGLWESNNTIALGAAD